MDADLSDLEPVGGLVGKLINLVDPPVELTPAEPTVIGSTDETPAR